MVGHGAEHRFFGKLRLEFNAKIEIHTFGFVERRAESVKRKAA
jgi:hypothetical protein